MIDANGKNLGVLPLEEALRKARERNLDLVQVTEKVFPPVCKIIDYGKYLYNLEKKQRRQRSKKAGELKGIRLGFNISLHDLEIKAKMAERFLQEGNKVRIEMVLRGREKALTDFAKGKIEQFLKLVKEKAPIEIEKDLERRGNRLLMIITKK